MRDFMKRLFLLALLPLVSLPARAQDVPRMERVIQEYVNQKAFMGAVLVVKDDKVILDKGYGSANLEWNIPNTPATKFRLGSLTKQFTAASILLLEERGKLSLTDAVKKYLPDAPAAWDRITIYNLLTHTSGIPNMTGFDNFPEVMRKTETPAQLIAGFRDKPLDFPVGEKFSYSNSGYLVLGAVIEKIAGTPYAQFVQDNLFKPLDMKDTGYDNAADIIPMRAAGYSRRKGELVNSDFIDMSIPYSAGSLYSTTHDLWTWEKALFGGKVVSAASLRKMTTPFKDDYGFGLIVHNADGHRQIFHNGGINGFSTVLSWYPDDKLIVVVLDNVMSGAPGQMLGQLAAVSFGKPVILTSERKEVAIDAKLLARYVGRYELRPGLVLEITQEGDHLFAQATNQPRLAMFAQGKDEFFTRAVDSQASFVTEGDAPASALVLHQGGNDITAKRVP
jgi:CubicO group peptidase (beta-lactamase class C family)